MYIIPHTTRYHAYDLKTDSPWSNEMRAACDVSPLDGSSEAKTTFGPPDDLKVCRLLFWSDQVMANQEIDQYQTTIRLEIARM